MSYRLSTTMFAVREHARGRGSIQVQPKRKLIEVSLPLEAINRESAREKSIRHGHPSTLHLWWARRPLAAARAVLFAQLVDDPSSHPDKFPTEEDQKRERARLHGIIERLVIWENIRDEKLLAEAHEEILKSTDGNPPAILDPFAGGGTIPLEAQRLGLEAHASDLNPVAVLINKALIEIPAKFRGSASDVSGPGGIRDSRLERRRGAGGGCPRLRRLDARRSEQADRPLYPRSDGKTVIAWIWARTVTCPNPACGIEMPLVRVVVAGQEEGQRGLRRPDLVADAASTVRATRIAFEHGQGLCAYDERDGTVGRTGAACVAVRRAVPSNYIRSEGRAGAIGRS